MQHPTCIAFHRANKLGDDVVALKAFYAAKILYPHTKILVFTNTFGATLYSCAPFVDEIINLDDDISFAQHTIDILIITHRTSHNIALAKRINAKKKLLCKHIYLIFCYQTLSKTLTSVLNLDLRETISYAMLER